ncbi:UbiA family prenyltransferase [bacterium]|nr:UbiA family prenyltransferase [bacterium]
MRKLQGLFRLLRFELPLSAGVCVVLGQVLALGHFAPLLLTLKAFLSIFCISAAILVLNDCIDVETDRVNAPQRPIPSGAVRPAEALALAIALFAAGFVLGWRIGIAAFLCVLALAAIGYLYNRHFKKTGLPGNLMVSFSVGMTFIYGGISVGLTFDRMVWFFGLIAALVDLGEEIAADAMDAAGDRLIGSRSLAIRHGGRAALRVSACIFLLVLALTAVPFVLGWFRPVYLIAIGFMDLSIAISLHGLLKAGANGGRKYIRRLYLGATAGLVLFLLLRLAGV